MNAFAHTFAPALVALAVVFAAPALAADARNINVINETGYDIRMLGFNGPDDGLDDWDNELSKPLTDNASVYVTFDDDDEGCVWNIKVAWVGYSEKESVYWRNVNLCKMTALRLRYDSKNNQTSFVAE